MAYRALAEDVKAILIKDYDSNRNPNLNPFIKIANLIVNRLVIKVAANGDAILQEELTEIEKWVAAHVYVMSDQNYSSNSTEGASASYQGQTGKYLEASKYGQMAILLDPTGLLIGSGKQARASAEWIGNTYSETLNAEDR